MRVLRIAVSAALLTLSALLGSMLSLPAVAAKLVIAGSSTVSPVMRDIARRFESSHPGTSVEVRTLGSGPGVGELRAGRCEIAMISRPVGEAERDLFSFPLARDGAAIVVNRSNPVRNITAPQLAELLTGKLTSWSELGGPARPIRVAWRPEGQGLPEIVLQQLKLKYADVRSHAVFFENSDAVKYAAENRDAVAFAALGVVERLAKAGHPVKTLSYEGVPASSASLRDHTYALSRPLILLTRSMPGGLQKQLIDYATSRAVVDLLQKYGHIPYGG